MTDTINPTPAQKALFLCQAIGMTTFKSDFNDGQTLPLQLVKEIAFIAIEEILKTLNEVGFTCFMYEEYEPTLYWEAVREAIKVL